MSLQRLIPRHKLLRHPTILHPTLTPTRTYAAKGTAETVADGASEKTPQNAEPKILNRAPPAEDEESKRTAQHNENMEQRADKQHNESNNENTKGSDTVGKGFWQGQGGEGGA